jgi:hypothetical protein
MRTGRPARRRPDTGAITATEARGGRTRPTRIVVRSARFHSNGTFASAPPGRRTRRVRLSQAPSTTPESTGETGADRAAPPIRRLSRRANWMQVRDLFRDSAINTKTSRLQRVRSAPERIRTSDLRFRRPTLYPAELRAPKCSGRQSSRRSRAQRRGRDSNPRWSFPPHTRLAGECLQPLGHLSGNGGIRSARREAPV